MDLQIWLETNSSRIAQIRKDRKIRKAVRILIFVFGTLALFATYKFRGGFDWAFVLSAIVFFIAAIVTTMEPLKEPQELTVRLRLAEIFAKNNLDKLDLEFLFRKCCPRCGSLDILEKATVWNEDHTACIPSVTSYCLDIRGRLKKEYVCSHCHRVLDMEECGWRDPKDPQTATPEEELYVKKIDIWLDSRVIRCINQVPKRRQIKPANYDLTPEKVLPFVVAHWPKGSIAPPPKFENAQILL